MFRRFKVSGNSMLPALADGQYVIGESLTYKFRNPTIGDIVVLKSPNSDMNLIKRIIKRQDDDYFVEGDNKNESRDSRDFGLIRKENILFRTMLK